MFPVLMEGTSQNVAIGAASVQCATAFGIATHAILATATSNCHIRVSVNPTAVATDFLLKAGDPPLVIGVSPTQKIAVIQDSAAGILYIQEVCS